MSPTCSRWNFEQTNRSKEGVKAPCFAFAQHLLWQSGQGCQRKAKMQNIGKVAKTRQGPIEQGNLDLSLSLMQSWCDWLPPFIQMGKIPLYNQDRQSRKQSKGVKAYYWWWIRLTWNISGPNGLVCGWCGRITVCSSQRVSKESCHIV